jgi:hypothetical protein
VQPTSQFSFSLYFLQDVLHATWQRKAESLIPLWLLFAKHFEVPVYYKSFKNTVTTSQNKFAFPFQRPTD